MHEPLPIATLTIIFLTTLVSHRGFRDPVFEDRFIFTPEPILAGREGWRLITSGFLHSGWTHLLFNMYSLYAFGQYIELIYGAASLLVIYFASIIGGSLLSLFLHRNHVYRAYGASGGVCGVIFASIFLLPGSGIMALFIPFSIPAWLYAILYLGLSYWALRAGRDNIGHDAHIGGAIIGLLTATALYPSIVTHSPWLFAAVMGLSVAILVFLVIHPLHMPGPSFTFPRLPRFRIRKPKLVSPRPSAGPTPDEVNRILDKISKSGMESLTKAEHETLRRASKKS